MAYDKNEGLVARLMTKNAMIKGDPERAGQRIKDLEAEVASLRAVLAATQRNG